MELSRDITLGQYVPRNSPIHRLDPRTKIILWAVLVTLLFLVRSFTGYLTFALFMGLLVHVSQIPVGYTLRGLRPALPFIAALFVIQILFSGSLYPESAHVLFHWRFIRVTAEALYTYSLTMVRVVLLFWSVTILTLTTSLVGLTDGMESLLGIGRRIGVPANELAMVMVIALRFVPTLVDELERIMKAQMARGAEIETGNFVQRTRQRIPILIPLLLNTFARAEDLILAMEARCYRGGKGRTKRRQLRVTGLDYRAIAVVVAFCGLMLTYTWVLRPPW
ncbi:MAG: energy-coupling factor transporter transmembrane component T [Bacillota bacterium]|nr:energy-coupling factor transporter transmembrane component T [Bacillota bacterium]